MGSYHIRTMRAEELQIAIDWARKEGWNPGLHDSKCFYTADPTGFFIGELNGEVISVASGVNYDPHSSFFGLYIVKKEYRGRGYGLKLTDHCFAYNGERNIGLDGVLENVEVYKKKGFKPYYVNQRFKHIGLLSLIVDPAIQPINQISFEELYQYDQKCFFGERRSFLKEWISQPESTAVAYIKNDKLLGYGVCRKCHEGYKIGPLFADNGDIADAIFLALQNNKVGEEIFIDIPETNVVGQQLVEKYEFRCVFSVMRMYQKYLPELDYPKIVGVTTYELG